MLDGGRAGRRQGGLPGGGASFPFALRLRHPSPQPGHLGALVPPPAAPSCPLCFTALPQFSTQPVAGSGSTPPPLPSVELLGPHPHCGSWSHWVKNRVHPSDPTLHLAPSGRASGLAGTCWRDCPLSLPLPLGLPECRPQAPPPYQAAPALCLHSPAPPVCSSSPTPPPVSLGVVLSPQGTPRSLRVPGPPGLLLHEVPKSLLLGAPGVAVTGGCLCG